MNYPEPPNSDLHNSSTGFSLEMLRLRLYVAGGSPNSVRALANLKMISQHYLDSDAEVEVVDIWQEPGRALADGILVTPTLRRITPLPEVSIIGDLSDIKAVTVALGIAKVQK